MEFGAISSISADTLQLGGERGDDSSMMGSYLLEVFADRPRGSSGR